MLIGAHTIIYSTRPEKDRAFLRDVLKLPHVDVGDGWLIFGLPPGEVAVHPSQKNDLHEFYLMCADVEAFAQAMHEHGVGCGAVMDMGWGRLVQVVLPGGGKLGVYEPRHGRPPAHKANGKGAKKKARKAKAPERKGAKVRKSAGAAAKTKKKRVRR
jgi:hypothetical protein